MNDAWRQADVEAHEAKADAIAVAQDALAGLDGLLDPLTGALVRQAQLALDHERKRHDDAAKLSAA